MMLAMLGVIIPFAAATTANAQTRRVYNARTHTWVYKKPNFYRRHRKLVNIAGGTAGGMALGALIGGRKGALIGGAAGAGTGYIVTKKQRPKHYTRRYRRY